MRDTQPRRPARLFYVAGCVARNASPRAFPASTSSPSFSGAADRSGSGRVREGELDDHWAQRAAMNPASLGKALLSKEVLRFLRRDIRKREGLLIDEEDLATALHDMMSTEARELMGPMRIRRRRKATKKPETMIKD